MSVKLLRVYHGTHILAKKGIVSSGKLVKSCRENSPYRCYSDEKQTEYGFVYVANNIADAYDYSFRASMAVYGNSKIPGLYIFRFDIDEDLCQPDITDPDKAGRIFRIPKDIVKADKLYYSSFAYDGVNLLDSGYQEQNDIKRIENVAIWKEV